MTTIRKKRRRGATSKKRVLSDQDREDLELFHTVLRPRYGLTTKVIADMFGYASDAAFRNSTRRDIIRIGLVRFYKRTKLL